MTQGGTRPLSLAAGVDEAGRGPWAGPVVAAAVILGDVVPDGLTDSKRLSATKRERLFEDIMKQRGSRLAFAPCRPGASTASTYCVQR